MSAETFTLPIRGMTCASCVGHVERALKRVDGVDAVRVNLASERAFVELNQDKADLARLVAAVKDAGYDVPIETVTLPISGMACASCVSHVERALKNVEGVTGASVNLAVEKATVTFVPGVASLTDLRQAVADAGYEVLEVAEATDEGEGDVDQEEVKMQAARFRMRVAWAFTVPIILWMIVEMVFGIVWPNEVVFNLGMILLALPVLFWVGRKTYSGAWAALRHGYANMDTLIALGTGVALLTPPRTGPLPEFSFCRNWLESW